MTIAVKPESLEALDKAWGNSGQTASKALFIRGGMVTPERVSMSRLT